jgi:hypothetical protein
MDTLIQATPDTANKLPSSASKFFHHYESSSTQLSSSLQSVITELANSHQAEASLNAAKAARKNGDNKELAHLLTIRAPKASVWKTVLPTEKALTLTNANYRLSARLHLGLPPEPSMKGTHQCPSCGEETDDAWHGLSCNKLGAATLRHNAVVNTLYHAALAIGAQAEREPKGLSSNDDLRPDLQMYFPGTHMLTDVVVTHPLSPSFVANRKAFTSVGVARAYQQEKHLKYDALAEKMGAKLLPFAVETCGGLTPDAEKLIKCMAEEGEDQVAIWDKRTIRQHVHRLLAVSVQTGNAMMYYRLRKGGQGRREEEKQ